MLKPRTKKVSQKSQSGRRERKLTKTLVNKVANVHASEYLQAKELASRGFKPEQLIKAGFKPWHLKNAFGLIELAESRMSASDKRRIYGVDEKNNLRYHVRDVMHGQTKVRGIRSLLIFGLTTEQLIHIGLDSRTVLTEAKKLGIRK